MTFAHLSDLELRFQREIKHSALYSSLTLETYSNSEGIDFRPLLSETTLGPSSPIMAIEEFVVPKSTPTNAWGGI